MLDINLTNSQALFGPLFEPLRHLFAAIRLSLRPPFLRHNESHPSEHNHSSLENAVCISAVPQKACLLPPFPRSAAAAAGKAAAIVKLCFGFEISVILFYYSICFSVFQHF